MAGWLGVGPHSRVVRGGLYISILSDMVHFISRVNLLTNDCNPPPPPPPDVFPQGMDLVGVDLSNLDLRNINFKCANLCSCNLSNSDLSYCVFERADLSKATLDVSG